MSFVLGVLEDICQRFVPERKKQVVHAALLMTRLSGAVLLLFIFQDFHHGTLLGHHFQMLTASERPVLFSAVATGYLWLLSPGNTASPN